MHEFDLGVFKAVFKHILRVLYALGGDRIQTLNARYVQTRRNTGQIVTNNHARKVPHGTNVWQRDNKAVQQQCIRNEEAGCPELRGYIASEHF